LRVAPSFVEIRIDDELSRRPCGLKGRLSLGRQHHACNHRHVVTHEKLARLLKRHGRGHLRVLDAQLQRPAKQTTGSIDFVHCERGTVAVGLSHTRERSAKWREQTDLQRRSRARKPGDS